jgi:hypothetical protein
MRQQLLIVQLTIWVPILPNEVPPRDLTISDQFFSQVVIKTQIFNNIKMDQDFENMSLLDTSRSDKMHLSIAKAIHLITCQQKEYNLWDS